jgi:hypothetical protein
MKLFQNVIHRTTELYLTLVCNQNAGTVEQTNMTTMSYLFNDINLTINKYRDADSPASQ